MLVNLNQMLKHAQENHYAVGLFNTTDTDMLQAAVEAAEELRSPIIIGTAETLLSYGALELIGPAIINYAKRAAVPVVVHYDHGLTFERCMTALKLGFSSVMFDGSAKDYKTNIAQTREIVKIAHAFGATVEGEIGHVGDAGATDGTVADEYTTPQEAVQYIKDTGVDALAIAIGTAHGAYKRKPRLDFDRLRQIRTATDIPLVLHGGSGTPEEQLRAAIANGIAKVNLATEIKDGFMRALKSVLLGSDEIDLRKVFPKAVEPVKEDDAPRTIQDVNDDMIRRALEKHEGRRKAAAAELGISERTLYRKIKELKINEK